MWRYWLFAPGIGGLLVLIVAHAAFAARLRKAHPELWGRYCDVFWTFPSDSRTTSLKTEIYGRLHDKTTLRFLSFQRLSWVAYIAGALIAIIAFGGSMPPML